MEFHRVNGTGSFSGAVAENLPSARTLPWAPRRPAGCSPLGRQPVHSLPFNLVAPAPFPLPPQPFSYQSPVSPCSRAHRGMCWAPRHRAGEPSAAGRSSRCLHSWKVRKKKLYSVRLSATPPHPALAPPSALPRRTLSHSRCPSTSTFPAQAPLCAHPCLPLACFGGWRSRFGQGFEGSPWLGALQDGWDVAGMERRRRDEEGRGRQSQQCPGRAHPCPLRRGRAPMPAVPGAISHPRSLFALLGQGGYSARQQP